MIEVHRAYWIECPHHAIHVRLYRFKNQAREAAIEHSLTSSITPPYLQCVPTVRSKEVRIEVP